MNQTLYQLFTSRPLMMRIEFLQFLSTKELIALSKLSVLMKLFVDPNSQYITTSDENGLEPVWFDTK